MVRCGIPGMKTIRYHPFTCYSRLVHYTLFLFLHVKVEALLGRGWVFVLDCGLIYGAGGAVSTRHAWMARLVRLAPRTLIRERKKHQPTGNHFDRVLKCCRFFMKTHKLSSYFQIVFFRMAFYISYKHSRTMYVVPMERFNSNRWFQRYQMLKIAKTQLTAFWKHATTCEDP